MLMVSKDVLSLMSSLLDTISV